MTVFFRRAGQGPTLLLLHGIGSNSRSFRHQLTDLADAFTVVAWDAPGYGRSADPDKPFAMADYADRAAALLDDLGIEEAAVLGHSFGGVVAQVLYHRHPDRVRALILADTNVGGGALDEPERSVRVRQRIDALERLGPRGMAEQRAPALVSPGAPADLLAELIDIMAEVRSAGYSQAAMALGNADTSGLLSAIDVPTLVIHGEQDTVVPLATGQMLAQRISRAQLAVIPNAGHAAPQEQPAAFNAAVRAFLESLD